MEVKFVYKAKTAFIFVFLGEEGEWLARLAKLNRETITKSLAAI